MTVFRRDTDECRDCENQICTKHCEYCGAEVLIPNPKNCAYSYPYPARYVILKNDRIEKPIWRCRRKLSRRIANRFSDILGLRDNYVPL
jgi:hypothetical protein